MLVKGLLPQIKTEIWPRMTKNANYKETCENALTAETKIVDKDLSE